MGCTQSSSSKPYILPEQIISDDRLNIRRNYINPISPSETLPLSKKTSKLQLEFVDKETNRPITIAQILHKQDDFVIDFPPGLMEQHKPIMIFNHMNHGFFFVSHDDLKKFKTKVLRGNEYLEYINDRVITVMNLYSIPYSIWKDIPTE